MRYLLYLFSCVIFLTGFSSLPPRKPKATVVWQPSHQTDTGVDFSEAAVCDGIVEAAIKTKPRLNEFKVWSLNQQNLHHHNVGSNTIVAHTSAIEDKKISGYAYEIQESNKLNPDVFIAVHNNGGTKSHAIWGFVHDGDAYEAENKILAGRLIAAISAVTDLQNRGVFVDSSTGRNDYKCKTSDKRAFYSLDENVNKAKYRVLLEIGDNAVSKAFLEDPTNQKIMGQALKAALDKWMAEKKLN